MPSIASIQSPEIHTWISGQVITPDLLNKNDVDQKVGVGDLHAVAVELESHYASANEPIDQPAGKIYFNTDDRTWRGFKTARASTVYNILTDRGAYLEDNLTAGTATFKVHGVFDMNTFQQPGAVMFTLPIPADTLSANSSFLEAIGIGDTLAADTISYFFGNQSVETTGVAMRTNASGSWYLKTIVVRTSATTQKIGGVAFKAMDSVGASAAAVEYVTASATLSLATNSGFQSVTGISSKEIAVHILMR